MRYHDVLKKRYSSILGYTGLISIVVGLLILAPLLCLPFYKDESAIILGFVWPGTSLVLIGYLLSRIFLSKNLPGITYRDGSVVILLSWTLAVFAGAIPFSATVGLNFTQAIFESTSGWTTTGLSVVDVATAPQLVLLYRSILQLAGGAGFATIMLSALAGPLGANLAAAEGRQDRLVANVRQSLKLVLTMYSCYASAGIVLLRVSGMEWFDAINHCFAAISTGGFSTRPGSIGSWNSPGVEAITIVLMLLGATNFVTSYLLLKAKYRSIIRNSELRFQSFLLLVSIPLVFFCVTQSLYPTLDKALRVTVFELVSAATTTGFSTADYRNWKELGWIVMIVLMIIGGGTGSTAGGLKQYRVCIMYRGLIWEFKRRMLSEKAVTQPDVWHGEQQRFINDEDFRHVGLFIFLYMAWILVGTTITCAYGYPLRESLFEFASALGTVGLSVGVTQADAPQVILWTQTIGMLLGRLEFFSVIIGTMTLARDVRSFTP